MRTATVFNLLVFSFLLTVGGFLLSWIGGTDNMLGSFIGLITFNAAILTLTIFVIHFLLVALGYLFRRDSGK